MKKNNCFRDFIYIVPQDSEIMFVAWNKCLLWRGLIGLLSFITPTILSADKATRY